MPFAITAVSALVGALLFERLGVPAGSLLGAVAAVAAVNVLASFDPVELPGLVRFLAFAALGWAIGEGVTGETLRELRGSIGVIAAVVVVLVVAGAVLAWVLTRLGVLDGNTAYLTTSPGALSQMAALSTETGADSLLVATTHTIRVITVVLVAPLVSHWLHGGVAG